MTQTPEQERVHRVHPGNLRDVAQLRRSTTDNKVAGVAAGLGRHLDVDPTILRVAFVVLSFFGGAGLVLYGAAWLLVPVEGTDRAVVSTSAPTRTALLLTAAAVATVTLLGDAWGGLRFPWPLAVLALLAFVFLMNRDKPMTTQHPVGPVATAPPGRDDEFEPPPPWLPPPAEAAAGEPAPARDRGPSLFGPTLALVAIALGVLGLVEVAGGPVPDAAYAALALAVVGAMLVLGAWVGRAGALVPLGVVAAIALAVTSAAGPHLQGPRDLRLSPTTATAVRDSYFVPAGTIDLDLSRVHDVAALDGRTIDVGANAGELVVILPPGVDAQVSADISGAGRASVAGQEANGTNVHLDRTVDGGTDVPRLVLNLDLVVGNIEVRQS